MAIKERLHQAMVRRGIRNSADLARRAHLKESTARAYVNGIREPSLRAARQIGEALNISGDWLFTGSGTAEPDPRSSATPSEMIFAAVEEAMLVAGVAPGPAQSAAGVVQLVCAAHPIAPPGMRQTDAVRRLVRLQLYQWFPQAQLSAPRLHPPRRPSPSF